MVNAGAIAVAELFPGDTPKQRIGAMRNALSRFAGHELDLDESVFRSESETGHRNRAIAYLMRNSNMIRREPEDVLEVYFRQCSMLVNCRDLAVMAASLANDGVNPITGEAAMPAEFVQDVLSVMHSCGMYDYAGQWAHEVGIPAKIGVSGCVIAVIPGQIGIATYSPLLDSYGNSVRGVMACRQISADFGLHAFCSRTGVESVLRHELYGLRIRSKRLRTPAERAVLDRSSGAICIIEAQGRLYLGTAERLVHRIRKVAANATHVIVDFRHVQSADRATLCLLQGFSGVPANPSCRLIFSHILAKGPLANLRSALASTEGSSRPAQIFATLDDALEHVEEEILQRRKPASEEPALTLLEIMIFQNLDAEEIGLLTQSVAPKLTTFEPGQIIIRQGELGKTFFVIVRGSASVELPSIGPDGRTVQIASVGKSLAFGHLALIEGRTRGAQVVAETELVCYAISVEDLRAFGLSHPGIYGKILTNIISDLADTLRASNETIRALER
jgi:glutaminase